MYKDCVILLSFVLMLRTVCAGFSQLLFVWIIRIDRGLGDDQGCVGGSGSLPTNPAHMLQAVSKGGTGISPLAALFLADYDKLNEEPQSIFDRSM
jgi:hypothetical protein